jgi:hypothetical protein
MSGSGGSRNSGPSAAVQRRSCRAGVGRLAGVLSTALLLLAGLVAAAWVGVSPAAATSTPVWSQLSPGLSPPARDDASMAYDPATSQLVLFGGFGSGTGFLSDTWTWNGTTWTQLSPAASPPGRDRASLAYDPATSLLVLFGGNGGSGRLGDTWTWNGTTWTQLSPAASPPGRYNASLAYDPDSSQFVLFGGSGGSGNLADTWTWDGATWSQLSPAASPPARTDASMTYDPAASQFVLFGGNGNLADTWTFSVTTVSPGPAPPPTTTISQAGPVGGRITAADWARFTGHLDTTGQHGWTRYVTKSKACGLEVSSSGKITTTGRFKGRCTVSGTDSDTGATADSGTWTYTLTIGSVTIAQRGPKTATTTMAASAAFTGHFRTNGGRGRVRYVTTSRACGVIVSPAGAIRTSGRLKVGRCTVSGTDSDPGHARGKWSFTLTVGP